MADDVDVERREGQEGSRWYNKPPSGKELSDWFSDNVDLHEKLDPKHYVQGVTMIPNVEKAKAVVGWNQNGSPVIAQVENLVFTPYAKVETRVKYFHDLMALHPEWVGVIEPVVTETQIATLPPGFFRYSVQGAEGATFNFVCCSMKVTVFERESLTLKERLNPKTGEMERWRDGKTVIDGAPAVKMIATLGRYGPDSFALMKAETGAIGRALGLAGMLVIPGTGIATAEDLEEVQAMAGNGPAATPEEEVKPPEDPQPTPESQAADLIDLRQQAVAIITTLKDEFPVAFNEFKEWAQERKIGEVGKLTDPRKLHGLITKADRDLTNEREKAKKAADDAPPAED
jgi:hypothetical protein